MESGASLSLRASDTRNFRTLEESNSSEFKAEINRHVLPYALNIDLAEKKLLKKSKKLQNHTLRTLAAGASLNSLQSHQSSATQLQ